MTELSNLRVRTPRLGVSLAGSAPTGNLHEDNGKCSQGLTFLGPGFTLTVRNRQAFVTCADLVNNGDSATFSGSYNLNTTNGQINVQP